MRAVHCAPCTPMPQYKTLRGKFVDEFDNDAEGPIEVKEQKDLEDTSWFKHLKGI